MMVKPTKPVNLARKLTRFQLTLLVLCVIHSEAFVVVKKDLSRLPILVALHIGDNSRESASGFTSRPLALTSTDKNEFNEQENSSNNRRITAFTADINSSSDNNNNTATNDDHIDSSTSSSHYWTREQLEDFADRQGIILSLTTLGPGFRAVARIKADPSQILAYGEGFVRPASTLLHLDSMRVFQSVVKQARQKYTLSFNGGTFLGIGLLVGYMCLLYGYEQKTTKAEFLAIHDDDFQHERLVKFYKQSGFKVVKYVGDDWKDIPDRLVWGGCGTLLRQDVLTLLQYWTKLMETSQERILKQQQQQSNKKSNLGK